MAQRLEESWSEVIVKKKKINSSTVMQKTDTFKNDYFKLVLKKLLQAMGRGIMCCRSSEVVFEEL